MRRAGWVALLSAAAGLIANGCGPTPRPNGDDEELGGTATTSCGARDSLGGSANGDRAGGSGEASRGCGSANCAGNSNLGDAGCGATTCGGSSDVGQAGCAPANCAGSAGEHDGEVGPNPPIPDRSRDILETALEIDASNQTAVATITLTPSSSRGASFEVRGLAIASITHSGGLLQWAPRGAWIDVGVPPSTEPLVLRIEYSWVHQPGGGGGVSPRGYTLTWPYFCGSVFPCHSDPADGLRFRLHVTGATGTALYPAVIPEDAPPYMLAWTAGDYTQLSLGETAAGTQVSIWHLANGAADATVGGAHLLQAFDWLERNLGAYRFGSDVASVAVDWGPSAEGGMEHHPYWHIASPSMRDEATHVHEAAHGWFGNAVRLRCWEDFVLSEGTASYLAARVLEEVAGSAVSDAVWLGYQTELEAWRSTSAKAVAWPQACGVVDILGGLFSRVPYVKGALFLRALEQRISRPQFDTALRTFYTRFAGSAARMRDLLDVVSEVSEYDPKPCAQKWLIDPTVPENGDCQ